MIFIIGTLIAYGVLITMKDSDRRYDLGVKGQGQIYLRSVLWLVTPFPLSYYDG